MDPKKIGIIAAVAGVVVVAGVVGVDVTSAPKPKTMQQPDRKSPKGDADPAYTTAKDLTLACACAVGPACAWWQVGLEGERRVREAPFGITLAPGTWKGPDCLPKPCIERGAKSTWPKACPLK